MVLFKEKLIQKNYLIAIKMIKFIDKQSLFPLIRIFLLIKICFEVNLSFLTISKINHHSLFICNLNFSIDQKIL